MLASNNILKPQDGQPVVCPTQDMIIGCYYLTLQRDGEKGEGRAFSSEDEAVMAYQNGEITPAIQGAHPHGARMERRKTP